MATDEEAKPTPQSDPGRSNISKEQPSKDAGESAVSAAAHTEIQSNSTKESGGGAETGTSQSKEPVKDEDMIPVSEDKEADASVTANSTEEKESTGIAFRFLLF